MYNAAASHATTTPLDFSTLSDCYNLYAQAVSPHVIVRVMVNLPAGSTPRLESRVPDVVLKSFRVIKP